MKEHPILFTSAMVRAILDGRKTQTRRIGKFQKDDATELGVEYIGHATKGLEAVATYRAFPDEGSARWGLCPCPYGVPGDRLWAKETHYWDRFEKLPTTKPDDFPMDFYYRADGECCEQIPECQCGSEGKTKWRPSIFMPRWASRITLEITNVRVERLQDISESEAMAEGVIVKPSAGIASNFCGGNPGAAQFEYYALWESINGKGSWARNPWVWVIEYKRIKPA